MDWVNAIGIIVIYNNVQFIFLWRLTSTVSSYVAEIVYDETFCDEMNKVDAELYSAKNPEKIKLFPVFL